MITQAAKPLKLTIMSPEETLFDGEVKAISCHNPKGYFDVLYEHTNFMSMIDEKLTVIMKDGKKKDFKIEAALIHVQDNSISVLVNIAMSQKSSFFQNLMSHVKGSNSNKKRNKKTSAEKEETKQPIPTQETAPAAASG